MVEEKIEIDKIKLDKWYIINNVPSLCFIYSRLSDLQITAYLRH